MGKQASDSVYYLTESPHAIHADIIAAINRSPEEPAEAAPNSPAPTATGFDISAPLARIEEAWHHIESCSERIQELEAVVESLKNREAEVTSQLNEAKQDAAKLAEELAAEMLATTLDVDFDADKSWDEKKEIYRISNKIVRTANITQSAVGDKHGRWTTVIAAAILIFE